MRISLSFLVLTIFSVLRIQQPPLLDLTTPFENPSQQARAISETTPLQMAVEIIDPPDQGYTVGEEFQYEVEITNTSAVSVSIPWSADPTGLDDVSNEQVFQASVALMLRNGANDQRVLTGAIMYGRPDISSSILVLAPGMKARIRAASRWSVSGIRMTTFVAPQSGRVNITAIYRLQTGMTVSSTAPSSPRGVTLTMPGV